MAGLVKVALFLGVWIISCFSIINGIVVSKTLNITLNHGGILIGRHLTSHFGRNFGGFLGIPYAKPPLGELRFSAPLPADSWEGERMAITDGNICSQVDIFFNDNLYQGEEDCLYLNVYVPENPKTKSPLPVMVWIPGGGFVFGTGMSSFYDPKLLMDKDIVLVAVNYRVGTLGFLSSETLDIPGNFGLKDQLLALKWVQEHISSFGGNPKNVTIFGESAGAVSVVYLTNSPKTEGLFQRAIAQSGSFYNRWGTPGPKGYASDLALKISDIVGCRGANVDWKSILKCLRSVPGRNLTEAANQFLVWQSLPWPVLPIVVEQAHEQAFLTQLPEVTNRSKTVPMILGYAKNEGLAIFGLKPILPIDEMNEIYQKYGPVLLNYQYAPKENLGKIKQLIDEFYFNNNPIDYVNLTSAISDSWFISGIDKFLQNRFSVLPITTPTYCYEFNNKGFSVIYYSNDKYYGTSHFDDVFYLYPLNDNLLPSLAPTQSDLDLRKTLIDLWYNFASQGNPTLSHSNYTKWTPMESYPPKSMHIGNLNKGEKLLQMSSEYPLERVQFWRKLETYINN